MKHALITLILFAGLAGCSSNPNFRQPRAALKEFGLKVDQQEPRAQPIKGMTRIDRATSKTVSEKDIADQFRDLAKLIESGKLAIIELSDHANTQLARPIDSVDLEAFKKKLAGDSPFRTVETVPDFLLPTELSLRTLRYCAARTRADLLLLMTRASERYDYNNAWSNLYPTIVGWLLVPGNTLEIHSHVEAALVDVRTGQILGVVTAEQRNRTHLLPLGRNRASMRELSDENSRQLFAMLADKTLEMTKQIK